MQPMWLWGWRDGKSKEKLPPALTVEGLRWEREGEEKAPCACGRCGRGVVTDGRREREKKKKNNRNDTICLALAGSQKKWTKKAPILL